MYLCKFFFVTKKNITNLDALVIVVEVIVVVIIVVVIFVVVVVVRLAGVSPLL